MIKTLSAHATNKLLLVVMAACFLGGAYLLNPIACMLLGAFVAVPLFRYLLSQVSTQQRHEESFRGRKLRTYEDVCAECDKERDGNDRGVLWGKVRIPSSLATSHFCVVGAVGSGKTVSLRMLMRDQLPLIREGSDARAIIYDPKQDMVRIAASIIKKGQCELTILNPFDKRSKSWDMAADIDSPAAARQLAETLVPPGENESQPFFSNAVRELLVAVVTVLVSTRPRAWTLRDLLLIMRSKALLREVLQQNAYTQDLSRNFLDSGEVTVGSIFATVATKLGPYEAVAAAWERVAKKNGKISISQWLQKSEVLILGNDERVRSILDTVNKLFVAIAAQQVLTMSESDTRRTWFYFDEFSEAGRLPGLESIILRGRSKGCCVVLGFQDISHVHEVYGENLGNTLVGQCGNKAFLRIESPNTADWASKSIGDAEMIEVNRSTTVNAGQASSTDAEQLQARAVVLPSEFMDLSAPDREKRIGMTSVYIVRNKGAFRSTYTYNELTERLGSTNVRVEPMVQAPTEWQYLAPWSDQDAVRLSLNVRQATAGNNGRHSLDDIARMQF